MEWGGAGVGGGQRESATSPKEAVFCERPVSSAKCFRKQGNTPRTSVVQFSYLWRRLADACFVFRAFVVCGLSACCTHDVKCKLICPSSYFLRHAIKKIQDVYGTQGRANNTQGGVRRDHG